MLHIVSVHNEIGGASDFKELLVNSLSDIDTGIQAL